MLLLAHAGIKVNLDCRWATGDETGCPSYLGQHYGFLRQQAIGGHGIDNVGIHGLVFFIGRAFEYMRHLTVEKWEIKYSKNIDIFQIIVA